MSPKAICPKCGKKRLFHDDELDDVRDGVAICTKCTLEHGYNVFLGEVLAGEHKELIDELKARLEEEAE